MSKIRLLILAISFLISSISLASLMNCSALFLDKTNDSKIISLPNSVDNYIYWPMFEQSHKAFTTDGIIIKSDPEKSTRSGFLQLNNQWDIKFFQQVFSGKSYDVFLDKINAALDTVFKSYAKRNIIPESIDPS